MMIYSAYKYIIITATFILFCYGFYEILTWLWTKRLDLSNEDILKKYTSDNLKNSNVNITIMKKNLS
jgi:hypothetical protein